MSTNPTPAPMPDKHALTFGLISVFLCGIGFTIISPVVPFLVQPYVSNPADQAIYITLLTSVYALCMFLASPVLGALSDRFGRKPLLLACLVGSAIGYTIFGIGGALWVLFVGRVIEGITAGEIGTIFAYFADIIPREQRTKYFGWVSAVVGVGTVSGPVLGGLLAHFGYAVPLFFGALITLLNAVYGHFFMPESLKKENRSTSISVARLNPFAQLKSILSVKVISRLLMAGCLIWLPNGSFQAIFSQFTIDTFDWRPVLIGLMFSVIGAMDIFSQALVMPHLLKKLSDRQIATLGMSAEILGYILIAVSPVFSQPALFVVGMVIFGFGDSIFGPSFNGMLSKSVADSEQGRVQGGSQSIQALAKMIGPVVGGQLYVLLGHSAPAVMSVVLIAVAIMVLRTAPKTVSSSDQMPATVR